MSKDKDIKIVEPEGTAISPIEAPKAIEVSRDLSVESLIAQAITSGVPVDTMERLLAMRRELRAEKAKEAFDADMAKFQGACPVIEKTKPVKTKSGQVAYRYAPLDVIVAQVKDLLNEHGFSYAIQTETLENKVKVTCITKHKSGHSENNSVEVPLGNKTDIMSNTQVVAAALTFAKRYAFCNAFGILTGDEDDDGQSTKGLDKPSDDRRAPSNPPANNQPSAPKVEPPRLASDGQRRKIFALGKDLDKTPEGTKDGVKQIFKLESFSYLTSDQASKIIAALGKKLEIKRAQEPEKNVSENAESDTQTPDATVVEPQDPDKFIAGLEDDKKKLLGPDSEPEADLESDIKDVFDTDEPTKEGVE